MTIVIFILNFFYSYILAVVVDDKTVFIVLGKDSTDAPTLSVSILNVTNPVSITLVDRYVYPGAPQVGTSSLPFSAISPSSISLSSLITTSSSSLTTTTTTIVNIASPTRTTINASSTPIQDSEPGINMESDQASISDSGSDHLFNSEPKLSTPAIIGIAVGGTAAVSTTHSFFLI